MSLISGLVNHEVDVYSMELNEDSDYTHTKKYSNMPCRWEAKTFITNGVGARVKEFMTSIWFLPDYSIEENYEIRKDGKKYRVVFVEPRYDLDGNLDHYKALLE